MNRGDEERRCPFCGRFMSFLGNSRTFVNHHSQPTLDRDTPYCPGSASSIENCYTRREWRLANYRKDGQQIICSECGRLEFVDTMGQPILHTPPGITSFEFCPGPTIYDGRPLKVVVYNSADGATEVRDVYHMETDMTGMNIVAVVGGVLCCGCCQWCDDLDTRIASRTCRKRGNCDCSLSSM